MGIFRCAKVKFRNSVLFFCVCEKVLHAKKKTKKHTPTHRDKNKTTKTKKDDLCSDIHSFSCQWNYVLDANQLTVSYEYIASNDNTWMTLLAINCDESNTFSAHFELTAINSNGEYLSESQIPYKSLYIYFAGVWGFLTSFWFFHWQRYRYFNTALHKVMNVYPFLMTGFLFFFVFFVFLFLFFVFYKTKRGYNFCLVLFFYQKKK